MIKLMTKLTIKGKLGSRLVGNGKPTVYPP
jgi:hypothetical protein